MELGTYADIEGSSGIQYCVKVVGNNAFTCNCPHYTYRLAGTSANCKHILEALRKGKWIPPTPTSIEEDKEGCKLHPGLCWPEEAIFDGEDKELCPLCILGVAKVLKCALTEDGFWEEFNESGACAENIDYGNWTEKKKEEALKQAKEAGL